MSVLLRVLIIDDSEDDALLIIRDLKKGGYNPVYERVDTAAAMEKALKKKQWDIILCDYSMPKFNAPSALALLKEANIDTPAIIISGTIGEETAVECMRLGAHDYFMKSNLSRLSQAIARELEEAEVRNKQKQADEALLKSAKEWQITFDATNDAIWILDQNQQVLRSNKAAQRFFHRPLGEMIGKHCWKIVHGTEQPIPECPILHVRKSLRRETLELQEGERWFLVNVDPILDEDGLYSGAVHIVSDITERKKAEEDLHMSEERFRLLSEASFEAIAIHEEGVLLNANDQYFKMFGYEPGEALGKEMISLTFAPESLEFVKKQVATGSLEPYESIGLRKDGTTFPVEIRARKMEYKGRIVRFGAIRDITERKREEDEHKAHIRFLESLERIDQAIKEETDVEQMLRYVLQEVFVIFDCDRAWLFYPCDPDAPTFRVPMEICRPEYPGARVLNMDVPMSPDMAQNLREALASDDPVIYIAGTEKPVNKVSAEQFGVQSQMFVALYPKMGKPWVFGMHQCSYPRIWTEEEKILFKEISRRISDGLSSVLYLHELQDNEVRLSEAQRLAQIGSWEWDLRTNHVWWSDETYRIFGVTPQDFVPSFEANGKFIHPDDFAGYSKSFEHSLQTGEPLDIDIRLVTNDGLLKHCQAKGKLIYDDAAQPTCFLGTIMDITERKQEEQALRETEERFAATFHATPNLIAITRMADGKIVDVNEGYSKMLGYSRDESIGRTTAELSIWADPADRATFVGSLKEFSEINDFETTLRRKDGTVVTVLDSARTIELQGEKCLLSIAHDITERKKAEEELHRLNRELRAISSCNQVLVREQNEQALLDDICRIICDEAGYRMAWVGYAEHDDAKTVRPVAWSGFDDGYVANAKLSWADDAKRAQDPGGAAIRSGKTVYIQDFTTDPRMAPWRESALQRGYRSAIALPLKDENANVFGVLLIYSTEINSFTPYEIRILEELASDLAFGITSLRTRADRDQTEVELRESEERYRLIAENTADTIAVFDLNLNPTYISPSITKLRGYTVQEEMTKTLDQMLTPDSLKQAIKNFSDQMALESSGTADPTRTALMELEEYCKDGSTIWVELAASFLRDNNFKPTAVLTVTRDITERKQAEKRLNETLSRLKTAVGTTIAVLGTASEARDPYTAGHQKRVADLARTIATEMGLSTNTIEGIRMAGSIHDIGKLSIPAEILSKPTKLTNIEFSLIKEHPRSGYEMLKDVESPWPLAEIVYQHHERMNGSGYPRNLKGDDILIEARIMAVADVVEAMASHRPYRPGLGIETALEEIEKNKGILYDAAVADACLRLFREKGYQLT